MWYRLSAQHIRAFNETLKYLETEESISIGERIQDYYLKYVRPYRGMTSPIPQFNPIEGYELSAGQRPKDMYELPGKLDRHLIISPRFYDLLREHKLSGHVIFDNVTLKNKVNSRNDYKYIHFYENMFDYLDYRSSTFCVHDSYKYDNMKLVYFESRENFEFEINNKYVGNGTRVSLVEAVIPEIENYDLLAFGEDTTLHLLMSDQLYRRIKKEKITGFRGSPLIWYDLVEKSVRPRE